MQQILKFGLPFLRYHTDSLRMLASPEAGLIDRDKTTRKRDWGNIVEHCLTAALGGEALCRLLGVDDPTRERVVSFLIVHDFLKRYEVRSQAAWRADRGEQHEKLKQKLRELDPTGEFLTATNEDYVHKGAYQNSTISQKIIHYIDNLCLGSTLTTPKARLDEVASRRTDLPAEYWAKELAVSLEEAEYFATILDKRGIDSRAEDIPKLLIKYLSN